mmetsp:Transcript_59729/g.126494  ORF Transcript_59729/g.126494 Transcript_59729/m.126494 type:complete len:226 (-) Transcript_59729:9-686(-)
MPTNFSNCFDGWKSCFSSSSVTSCGKSRRMIVSRRCLISGRTIMLSSSTCSFSDLLDAAKSMSMLVLDPSCKTFGCPANAYIGTNICGLRFCCTFGSSARFFLDKISSRHACAAATALSSRAGCASPPSLVGGIFGLPAVAVARMFLRYFSSSCFPLLQPVSNLPCLSLFPLGSLRQHLLIQMSSPRKSGNHDQPVCEIDVEAVWGMRLSGNSWHDAPFAPSRVP